MKRPSVEVLDSASATKCTVAVLEVTDGVKIREKIEGQFAHHGHAPLWERLRRFESVQDSNGWSLIWRAVSSGAVVMFFEKDRDLNMLRFSHGGDVVAVLRECTGFEFYLTNLHADYLLCFNHHDFLIGAGTAENWVRELKVKGHI